MYNYTKVYAFLSGFRCHGMYCSSPSNYFRISKRVFIDNDLPSNYSYTLCLVADYMAVLLYDQLLCLVTGYMAVQL